MFLYVCVVCVCVCVCVCVFVCISLSLPLSLSLPSPPLSLTHTPKQNKTKHIFAFQYSVEPRKVSTAFWNCSVSNWSDFQQHLMCDLVTECAGWEDERDCPYTGHCGPDRLTIDGQCYQYLKHGERAVRWDYGRAFCHR